MSENTKVGVHPRQHPESDSTPKGPTSAGHCDRIEATGPPRGVQKGST
jgi:hypothetical protein